MLQKQNEVAVDIVCDGELPRLGFSFYVKDRMSGFGGHSPRGTVTDFAKFPGYAKLKQQQASRGDEISKSATLYTMPECQCAVRYDTEQRAARQELQLFKASLERTGVGSQAAETFVTAATPGIVSTTLLRNPNNPDYTTDRDYVMALAEELRGEYELIVEHGHILQVDGPDLALERQILYVDQAARRLSQTSRAAYRGAQRRPGQHPQRPRASARMLGELGRTRTSTTWIWNPFCRSSTRPR